MIIGVPHEVKSDEYRVGLLPVGAELLGHDGHTVLVEKGAGLGSGFEDDLYAAVGARVVASADDVYQQADLIIKVKEPQAQEVAWLRADQIVFCYFHFAASQELTHACLAAKITAVAYETLADARHRLPLLTPMSEVAGKMSIQEGAKYLEKPMMGRGILLGGVAGVEPANVMILGGGVVGANAAKVAAGLGARVIILDIDLDRLRELEDTMPDNVTTIYCDPHEIAAAVPYADLLIGAVLIPGGRAPHLVSAEQVAGMRNGAVIVDVAIDQGGCIETARPTTHQEPTYIVDGVVHYCVTNIPGAVGRTSTQALCHATLPYARELARLGVDAFGAVNAGHAAAINMRNGQITNDAVAEAVG
ncbi:MAG: alanine dehydrogenase [Planctomycetaceae bacterium]|nr:alanine dehydrogenase [Planctomycetaceae bacterium]